MSLANRRRTAQEHRGWAGRIVHTVPLRRGPPLSYAQRLQSLRSKVVSATASASEAVSFFFFFLQFKIDEACVMAIILECN